MTPEERELLTRSIKLSEENNRMLRGMRRSARFSSILRAIYWLIILGSVYATYYFASPYINAAVKGYNEMQKSIESVKTVTSKIPSIPSMPELPAWLGVSSATTKK
jgi:hypothetical protein